MNTWRDKPLIGRDGPLGSGLGTLGSSFGTLRPTLATTAGGAQNGGTQTGTQTGTLTGAAQSTPVRLQGGGGNTPDIRGAFANRNTQQTQTQQTQQQAAQANYRADASAYGGTRSDRAAQGSTGVDMSRRPELAGQTVSSHGMNVVYDSKGFVSQVINPNHAIFAGTDRGILAPSMEAVLAGMSGGRGGGYDTQYMTDNELANIEHMRQLAQSGAISWEQANAYAEGIRAKYGYSGGADGSGYTRLGQIVFDPDDPNTQPYSPTFGQDVEKSTDWTTQRQAWGPTKGEKLPQYERVMQEKARLLADVEAAQKANPSPADEEEEEEARKPSAGALVQGRKDAPAGGINIEDYRALLADKLAELREKQNKPGFVPGHVPNPRNDDPTDDPAHSDREVTDPEPIGPGGIDPRYRDVTDPAPTGPGESSDQTDNGFGGPAGIDPRYRDQTDVDALLKEYQNLYTDAWERMTQQQRAALEAATEQAVNRLNAQKEAVNSGYRDLNRQNYVDKMAAQRDMEQALAAQGLTGGAAESTRLGLNVSYADALRRAEQGRLNELNNIDTSIADARYQGDMNIAQADAQAIREQQAARAALLQNLISRYDTQEAQQWARDYQTGRDRISDTRYDDETAWNRYWQQLAWDYQNERDKISDTRYDDETAWNRYWQQYLQGWNEQQANRQWDLTNQQWQWQQQQRQWNNDYQQQQWQYQQDQDAWSREQQERSYSYSLAMQFISAGIMPDDATLAAAGLTREQAEAMMQQDSGYTPTFSQAQVLDAAKRGMLTGNMLRDYNYYVYGDPDYNGTPTTPGSGSPGSGNPGNPGSTTTYTDAQAMNTAENFVSGFVKEGETVPSVISQQRYNEIRGQAQAYVQGLSGYSEYQKALILEYIMSQFQTSTQDPHNPGQNITVN